MNFKPTPFFQYRLPRPPPPSSFSIVHTQFPRMGVHILGASYRCTWAHTQPSWVYSCAFRLSSFPSPRHSMLHVFPLLSSKTLWMSLVNTWPLVRDIHACRVSCGMFNEKCLGGTWVTSDFQTPHRTNQWLDTTRIKMFMWTWKPCIFLICITHLHHPSQWLKAI